MEKNWVTEDNLEEFPKSSRRRRRERLVSGLINWAFLYSLRGSDRGGKRTKPGVVYLDYKKRKLKESPEEFEGLQAKELDNYFDMRYHTL